MAGGTEGEMLSTALLNASGFYFRELLLKSLRSMVNLKQWCLTLVTSYLCLLWNVNQCGGGSFIHQILRSGPQKQYKKHGGQHSQEIDSSEEGEEEEERLLLDDWDDWVKDD